MIKSAYVAICLALFPLSVNAQLGSYTNPNCTETDNAYLHGFYDEASGYFNQYQTQVYRVTAPDQQCVSYLTGAWGAGIAWWQAGYCSTAISLAQSIVYYISVRACG